MATGTKHETRYRSEPSSVLVSSSSIYMMHESIPAVFALLCSACFFSCRRRHVPTKLQQFQKACHSESKAEEAEGEVLINGQSMTGRKDSTARRELTDQQKHIKQSVFFVSAVNFK
jgi:hypothetical protein